MSIDPLALMSRALDNISDPDISRYEEKDSQSNFNQFYNQPEKDNKQTQTISQPIPVAFMSQPGVILDTIRLLPCYLDVNGRDLLNLLRFVEEKTRNEEIKGLTSSELRECVKIVSRLGRILLGQTKTIK